MAGSRDTLVYVVLYTIITVNSGHSDIFVENVRHVHYATLSLYTYIQGEINITKTNKQYGTCISTTRRSISVRLRKCVCVRAHLMDISCFVGFFKMYIFINQLYTYIE